MTSSVNLRGCENLVQYVWFYMKLYYAKPYMYVVVLVMDKFFIVPCVIFTYMKHNVLLHVKCHDFNVPVIEAFRNQREGLREGRRHCLRKSRL